MTCSPVEWAADVLDHDENILVPLKALWLEMQSQGIGTGLSVESFATLLGDDARFEFLEGIGPGVGDEEERMVMEELGFYEGPRVKLANRELTVEYVTRMLQQSTQSMLDALECAWEVRPEDDLEAEQQLLEILTMAQRLKHEVDTALGEVETGSGSRS